MSFTVLSAQQFLLFQVDILVEKTEKDFKNLFLIFLPH